MSENKLPNIVDRHVGRRIRWRRRERKLSQEGLAELLGLTFQQVQKYERGVNRVSAGRLYEVANVLDVPVGYFYDGIAEVEALADRPGAVHEAGDGMEILDKLDAESIELLTAFHRIQDAKLRRSILHTVLAAADALGDEDQAS